MADTYGRLGLTASTATSAPFVHYLDDDLLVVEKPAGLLCVPGKGADKADCLSSRVADAWPGALVVHRLDMSTSGLVIFARNAASQKLLNAAFADRLVEKTYCAIVDGTPPCPDAIPTNIGREGGEAGNEAPQDSGTCWQTINLPIAADWPRRPLRIIDLLLGKPSITRWRLAAAAADVDMVRAASESPTPADNAPSPWAGRAVSRLLLSPITGRTHQLRVHLAAIGHPIVGDRLYAPPELAAASPRLLLHAASLTLRHPFSGVPLRVQSPPPF